MAEDKKKRTIIAPPFSMTDQEMDDLFKSLEPDPASTVPDECGKPHPVIGKDLVCDKLKEHEDPHERYAKGEYWNWKNLGDK